MLSIVTDRYQLLWFTRLHYAKRPRMHIVVTMPNRNKMRQNATYHYHGILHQPATQNWLQMVEEKTGKTDMS